jgi:hypothetical protein
LKSNDIFRNDNFFKGSLVAKGCHYWFVQGNKSY